MAVRVAVWRCAVRSFDARPWADDARRMKRVEGLEDTIFGVCFSYVHLPCPDQRPALLCPASLSVSRSTCRLLWLL